MKYCGPRKHYDDYLITIRSTAFEEALNRSRMRIVNILDNGSKINYGVWISAVSTAAALRKKYGVPSEVWFPANNQPLLNDSVTTIQIADTSLMGLQRLVKDRLLNAQDTIIQTHGSWRFPTKWGASLAKEGFAWVYTPHGMLNKHGFSIKPWKKWPYWLLKEKNMIGQASLVRVVSSDEGKDLVKLDPLLTQVKCIANGIEPKQVDLLHKDYEVNHVLFMGRLFHGKGVVPMVKGWMDSTLFQNPKFKLIIAGPDQGELTKVKALLNGSTKPNVEYVGPIYHKDKHDWLSKANYFILPSFSEAFSTSILEAMNYGCLPLLTTHCHFPEVFDLQLGLRITTSPQGIKSGLERLPIMEKDLLVKNQRRAQSFIQDYYTLDHIADQQYRSFKQLLQPGSLSIPTIKAPSTNRAKMQRI